jgi:nitric oxide reductase NorQ protein
MKDLKQSTKQRFCGFNFHYPDEKTEAHIIAKESGVNKETAIKLVQVAQRARNLVGHGLDEGISTRLCVYAGQLIADKVNQKSACKIAMVNPITDDLDIVDTLNAAIDTFFE